MKQGLIQQQTLQRKMNQSLIQSLQMLQFTSMELYDYINNIAEENPLIDEVIYDYDFQPAKYKVSETYSLENMKKQDKSLYDYLLEQLITMDISDELRLLAEYGIYSLNELGYLELSLEEWAINCDQDIRKAEEALHIIQQLEPAGIGARSLGECLLLQIGKMRGYKQYMGDLLLHHLDWVADYDYEAIMEKYEVSENEITELNQLIQFCNPKPGELFTDDFVEYVMPEANIVKDEAGWKILFYNWSKPRLIFKEVHTAFEDEETKKYLKAKMQEVDWIKRAVAYRSSTIEVVIHKILEEQQAFFEQGVTALVPLKLKDIAEAADLHISTISRAINNKYLQTPHGLFPLKFFFQSGYRNGDQEVAAIVIKKLIHEIIADEEKNKPLSDEKIRRKLADVHSIQIARRTIMKYRQQLHIPASSKRKEKI